MGAGVIYGRLRGSDLLNVQDFRFFFNLNSNLNINFRSLVIGDYQIRIPRYRFRYVPTSHRKSPVSPSHPQIAFKAYA